MWPFKRAKKTNPPQQNQKNPQETEQGLNGYLDEFIQSREPFLKLDYIRQNGDLLFSVLKGYDILSYKKLKIKGVNEEDLVFFITFDAGKKNNEENFKRFRNEPQFKKFLCPRKKYPNQFFGVYSNLDVDGLSRKANEVFFYLYNLGSEPLNFEVGVYDSLKELLSN